MGDNFPKPGGVFQNRYRIGSVIGRGGFAQIYLAEQIDLGRQVALKVLNPGLRGSDTHSQEVAERFRREAKLVASLRDPHTITMHDYGRTDDALLYMVFEYIDGLTLSGLVRKEGRISARRTVKILRQCLLSLQEAHVMGVLHRDIKPANIMVYEHIGRTDQVKVLDFGIAKSVLGGEENNGGDLTQAGMIIGTPRYMAPEQLRGTPLGPQTDIYSLGLVAYELLAGQKAIELDSMVSIITRQVSDDPIQLPENLGLSPRVCAIVNAMLHKSEQERFQNANEILIALDALSEQDLQSFDADAADDPDSEEDAGYKSTLRMLPPVFAPDVDTTASAAPPTPTSSMPAYAPPVEPPKGFDAPEKSGPPPLPGGFSTLGTIPSLNAPTRKSRAPLMIVALVVLLLGGAGLYYLYTASQDTSDAAASDTAPRRADRGPTPPNQEPNTAPEEPTDEVDPSEDTPTSAVEIAQQEAAEAVNFGAALSASEQAQQAQVAADAATPERQAEMPPDEDRSPTRPPEPAPDRKKTTSTPTKPKRSTRTPRPRDEKPQRSDDDDEKKSSDSAPKKDSPSPSSFPALDGI